MAASLRPRRTLPLLALALSFVAFSSAHAQRRGGRSSGGSNDQGSPRGPASLAESAEARSAAKRLEGMASLKEVLKHVDGLSHAQKDSIDHVEKTYGNHLKRYGTAVKQLYAQGDAGGKPNFDGMRKLEEGAQTLRTEELGLVRGVLTTDAQRTQFDANVAASERKGAKPEGA